MGDFNIMNPRQPLTEHGRKNWAILETIRKKGPITKSDISQLTGINIVTVSNYVNDYLAKGLILGKGLDSSTGGRKPELIELNNEFAFAIGVDLGELNLTAADMVAVLTDLAGNIIVKIRRSRPRESMNELLDELVGLISELMENSNIGKEKIKGLGIGIPGIIDEKAGTIRDFSKGRMITSYLAEKSELEQKFGIPSFIDSSASLAAFGEKMMGLDSEVKNMVYMHSGTTCGIIINGEIYRGASGSTGEVSFKELNNGSIPVRKDSILQSKGEGLRILSYAKSILNQGVESEISQMVDGKLQDITSEVIVEAAKDNDKLAMELIEDAGVNLGMRIAYLVNIFNPEVVVAGGDLIGAGSLLLDPLRKTVKKYAFEETASVAKIIPAQLGENSAAIGAAGLVIREMFLQA